MTTTRHDKTIWKRLILHHSISKAFKAKCDLNFLLRSPTTDANFLFFVLCLNSKKEAFLDISNDDAMLYNIVCVCICNPNIFIW